MKQPDQNLVAQQYVPSPSQRGRDQVASYEATGGAPGHPAGYHNLIASPEGRLQDGTTLHGLRAREVFGEEKAEAWELAESRWPHFPAYRAKAGREIPILLLEPDPER